MSVLSQAVAAPAVAPVRRLAGWRRIAVGAGVLVVVMSAVRAITGAGDLTSSGTVAAALGLAVPIGMAGLGGLWSERSGVVNIGLEGMMILGTFGAGWIGWQHGPWAGLLAAVLFGAVGGLVHAIATVTFGVDQIVSGVAINILGFGVAKFLATTLFAGTPGGGTTQSPQVDQIGTLSLTGDLLKPVEKHGWFLVSTWPAFSEG